MCYFSCSHVCFQEIPIFFLIFNVVRGFFETKKVKNTKQTTLMVTHKYKISI
jgi:hypothetical protein